MGKAKQKQRECPAVGRAIGAVECGTHRASRYACPASCPFNPWAPDAYDAALAIEDALQAEVGRRLRSEPGVEDRIPVHLRPDSLEVQDFFLKHVFLDRDGAGRTFVERWAADGFGGLNNDERVLLQAQARMRPEVLEVCEVRDDKSCLFRDRLEPDAPLRIALDRSLACAAARFTRLLIWTYPMPHYWRMHANALPVPEVADLEAEDIVRPMVAHLGGPIELPALRDWLARNFVRMSHAFEALSAAFQRRMMERADLRYLASSYRLLCPVEELAEILGRCPEAHRNPLAPEHLREGFSQDWTLLAANDGPETSSVPFLAGRPTLGAVRFGDGKVRLESAHDVRHARLRQAFEHLAAGRAEFTGERVDDIGRQHIARRPDHTDATLVPPALLEHAPRIEANVRLMSPEEVASVNGDVEALMSRQHRRWLDDSVPAFAGGTPRQAAADPALRPRLASMVKSMIRRNDNRRLREGRGEDLGWVARELGLRELDVPPPPGLYEGTRAPGPEEQPDSSSAALPSGPFTAEEVEMRLAEVMGTFGGGMRLLDAFADDAPDVCDWLEAHAGDRMPDAAHALLMLTAAQAWFVFFAPGDPPDGLDLERLDREMHSDLAALDPKRNPKAPENLKWLPEWLPSNRQPALTDTLMTVVLETARKEPGSPPMISMDSALIICTLLRFLIDELDRTARGE